MKLISVLLLSTFGGIAAAASLQDGEWFLDTDPGVGSGTSFTAAAETSVTIPASAIDSLPPGVHQFGVRLRDVAGEWGHTVWRTFLRNDAPSQSVALAEGEWFLDADPGVGIGTPFESTSASFTVGLSADDLRMLAPGVHLMGVRLRDFHGRWGHTTWRTFLKDELTLEAPPVTSFVYRIVRNGEVVASVAVSPEMPSPVADIVVAHGTNNLQTGVSHGLQVMPVDSRGRLGHAAFAEFDYKRYADVWAAAHFTEDERRDPGIVGNDADPDGDGLTNSNEMLFALDPRDPTDAAKASPAITNEAGNIQVDFRVPDGGQLDSNGIYRTSNLSYTLKAGERPDASAPVPPSWITHWDLQSLDDGVARLILELDPPELPRRFFWLEAFMD